MGGSFFSGGRWISGVGTSDGQMIDLHPGVDLDKVSNELRTCHQLAEPWFAEFLWCGKESFCFGTVQKRQYRRIRIAQNFPHAPDQHLFVGRMVCLWIRAFLRQSSSCGSRSAQASRNRHFSTPFRYFICHGTLKTYSMIR